jgi:hypothetical protein
VKFKQGYPCATVVWTQPHQHPPSPPAITPSLPHDPHCHPPHYTCPWWPWRPCRTSPLASSSLRRTCSSQDSRRLLPRRCSKRSTSWASLLGAGGYDPDQAQWARRGPAEGIVSITMLLSTVMKMNCAMDQWMPFKKYKSMTNMF